MLCSVFSEHVFLKKAMNHSKGIYEREEDAHGLVKNEILIQEDCSLNLILIGRGSTMVDN